MQSQPPPIGSVRLPADFEPQEALVFGCGQQVRNYPQFFVDFVRRLHERVKLYGIVGHADVRLAEILLSVGRLPADAVEFVVVETSSMWVRDYSPISAFDANGERLFLNVDFRHTQARDDIPVRKAFEEIFGGRFVDVPLSLQGGNLLSNGAGMVITSKSVISQNALQYSQQQISTILNERMGCPQWGAVNPLIGERTSHADLIGAFLSPTLLAMGQCHAMIDAPNAESLDATAAALSGFETKAGKLEVVRIPVPSSSDGVFRSYTNLVNVNGLVLVPTYPSHFAELDQRVIAQFSELMPNHEVVGMDCSEVVNGGGSLHCMTMNVVQPRVAPVASPSIVEVSRTGARPSSISG